MFAACLLWGSLGAAVAATPGSGVALVAARDTGGTFHRSVIYLLSHDDTGSLGVIVNRPTPVSLAELLPDFADLGRYDHVVRYGGPVGMRALKFLLRSESNPGDALPVHGDVFASGSPTLLESLLRDNLQADRLRVFIGYSGWAPGQLAAELVRGVWYVVDLPADSVFNADESLWQELIERLDPPGIRTGLEGAWRAAGSAAQDSGAAANPDTKRSTSSAAIAPMF